METYRTEEEQVEALKKWWEENGRSTIAAVVLALAAGFGWQGWQEHREQQAELASLSYEELLEATQQAPSDEQNATIRHLAGTLKQDYSGSTYALFASLHLARLDVQEGNYAAAERELRSVLTANPPLEIRLLAELRLARVVAAGGDPQAALAIVTAATPGTYAAAYAEVEGDLQVQLGNEAAAIEAYERAVAAAAASGEGASESLQLKLQVLTPVAPRSAGEA